MIKVPEMVLWRIESRMASFLWNTAGEHRTHLVSWSIVCRQFLKGFGYSIT